ncbi:MAG: hypothetical protein AB8B53_04870 [Flavobacteriales bacterium]
MNVKKPLDHLGFGIVFAILGTLLGILFIEFYWLFKGYKLGTAWELVQNPSLRNSIITLSQVPNIGVFYIFFSTKRDRSAYGVILFFLLLAIPIAIDKFL